MAKSTKKNNSNTNRAVSRKKPTPSYPMPLPDTLSRDAFAALTDDELAARLDVLHKDLTSVALHSSDLSLIPWENEICYTHRELGARIGRRQAHEKYIGRGSR